MIYITPKNYYCIFDQGWKFLLKTLPRFENTKEKYINYKDKLYKCLLNFDPKNTIKKSYIRDSALTINLGRKFENVDDKNLVTKMHKYYEAEFPIIFILVFFLSFAFL